MRDDNTLKKWFEISDDELMARMVKQQQYHDEPLTKAIAMLDEARDQVMRNLGVDTDQPPEILQAQQEDLGIIVTQEVREEMAGLIGWFIFVRKKDDIIPYAWVGGAQLDSMGVCKCEIHYFNDNRLVEVKGVKVIK